MADIVSIGIERLDEALIDGKGITMGSSIIKRNFQIPY